jgi:F420-dependent oxidoreductase-like protein
VTKRPFRLGLFPGAAQMTWPQLQETWQAADRMGFSTCWIPDHFYSGYGSVEGSCLEAWTALSALAATTERVRLGTMVLGNTYRHPAVLANMAATLDHVSNGRLVLGIGAGWMQSEHDGYGIDLPAPRERLERLDEACQVLKLLWTEKRSNFEGKYYQLRDALCEPKPLQKPRIPLLIGGGGEKLTLRVVAKHADEWNGEANPAQMAHKIGVLHEHCRAVGRDPDEIEVGVLLRTEREAEGTYRAWVQQNSPNVSLERQRLAAEGYKGDELEEQVRLSIYSQFLPLDPDAALQRMNEYYAVGVSHVIVIVRPPIDRPLLERFIELAPRVTG